MKLVMYGAGSIGRGFIGPLFAESGYEVVFVDVNVALVDALNSAGRYSLHLATTPSQELSVTGVRAVNGRDIDAVVREIVDCDILATSLGAAILPRVAPILAQALQLRSRSLDILICENLKDSSTLLRGWIRDALPLGQEAALERCGLVETAIGRMVPISTQQADPLAVTVEAYDFLPVDEAAFLGPIPKVSQLIAYSPFAFYEERKLYLHNMGHAACAYLGLLKGYTYIAEAVEDSCIRLIVQNAMEESALMLSQQYGTPYRELHAHLLDLLYRFGNRYLGDTCERVARDPLRKLGADDRFAGAIKACRAHSVPSVCIAVGLSAALLHQTNSEAEAQALVRDVCLFPEIDAQQVLTVYRVLAAKGMDSALAESESIRQNMAGKIV